MASPLALAMMMPGANPPGQMQPTNVTAAYQLSQDASEKNYQAKLAQQNAMFGGLAGLGSAGILAAGAHSAAPAAAAAHAAAAAPLTGAAPVAFPGIGSLSDLFPAAATGATDASFAAGAPVAADLAATAAPAAADAGLAAGGFGVADLLAMLPFLA
jgi:hypothetical protein